MDIVVTGPPDVVSAGPPSVLPVIPRGNVAGITELEGAFGRPRVLTAGGTALELCSPSSDRICVFLVADGAAFVRAGPEDATVTTGIPIGSGFILPVYGKLARKRWTVVSAGTPIVAAIQYYPGAHEDRPGPGVPTGGE